MAEGKTTVGCLVAAGALFLALGGMCDAVTLSMGWRPRSLDQFEMLTFLSWPVLIAGLTLVVAGTLALRRLKKEARIKPADDYKDS